MRCQTFLTYITCTSDVVITNTGFTTRTQTTNFCFNDEVSILGQERCTVTLTCATAKDMEDVKEWYKNSINRGVFPFAIDLTHLGEKKTWVVQLTSNALLFTQEGTTFKTNLSLFVGSKINDNYTYQCGTPELENPIRSMESFQSSIPKINKNYYHKTDGTGDISTITPPIEMLDENGTSYPYTLRKVREEDGSVTVEILIAGKKGEVVKAVWSINK
jgi:hypothetical protein